MDSSPATACWTLQGIGAAWVLNGGWEAGKHLSQHQIPVAVGNGTHRIFPVLEKVVIATPITKEANHHEPEAQ